MTSWMAWAISSPKSRPTSVRPMSMPADTPAPVITLPRSTTRSPVGTAPSAASRSRRSQWQVASVPSRMPAAARKIEPVHTLVVHVVPGWTRANQRTTGWSASAPGSGSARPPGTTTTSGAVTSANDRVAVIESRPLWSVTGPAVSATKKASTPGTSTSVWNGPTMSSAVKRS
jgi:hypothetical protein